MMDCMQTLRSEIEGFFLEVGGELMLRVSQDMPFILSQEDICWSGGCN